MTAARHSAPDLATILAHWGIGDFKAKKIAMGGSASNWVVMARGGKYVLRNAGKPSPHVAFQLLVMDHVAKSEFPYATPRLMETKEGSACEYSNDLWLLYPYIEGRPARKIATTAEANDAGRLVAHYHQVVSRLDFGPPEDQVVHLFQFEKTGSVIAEHTAAMRARKRLRRVEAEWLRLAERALRDYRSIPEAVRRSTRQLDLIPAYNDWYPDNILMVNRTVSGLIDFDSLVAGPHVLDLQNALLYTAGTHSGFQADRIRTFLEGYTSVRPLSPSDVEPLRPLMLDRILYLLARAMRNGWPDSARATDGLISFLVRNLSSMLDRPETFRAQVMAGMMSASAQ